MMKLLKCEFMKTRRRYIVVTALLLTTLGLCWGLYGNYNDFIIKNGWMEFLYTFPVINTIFLPLLAVIVSSRLADTEHKGAMIRQMSVVCGKGRLYDVKFIYGLLIMTMCVIFSWAATIIFGLYMKFLGNVPLDLYAAYFAFTIAPAIEIYIIQHILTMLLKNQAVTFSVGIIGTFAGLFSMFLPNIPMLRSLLPWGHFGALSFVGLFGYTKTERYQNAYFENMGMNWTMFFIIIAVCIVLYAAGRKLFLEKEM